MSSVTTASNRTTTIWDIDPSHSGVHFSIRHLVIATVRGEFGKLSGTVTLDPSDLTRSSVQATIDAASISTRDSQRDAHLKSQDFLDVVAYPTIGFRSTRVVRTGQGTLDVHGDLAIHGVTRPLVLRVEFSDAELKDPFGNVKRAASATAKLNRKDFGLEWNVALETGGVLVGDELKIEIDLELVRRPDAA
jgi:polyisoprenoid-binding protein YceI